MKKLDASRRSFEDASFPNTRASPSPCFLRQQSTFPSMLLARRSLPRYQRLPKSAQQGQFRGAMGHRASRTNTTTLWPESTECPRYRYGCQGREAPPANKLLRTSSDRSACAASSTSLHLSRLGLPFSHDGRPVEDVSQVAKSVLRYDHSFARPPFSREMTPPSWEVDSGSRLADRSSSTTISGDSTQEEAAAIGCFSTLKNSNTLRSRRQVAPRGASVSTTLSRISTRSISIFSHENTISLVA